ncbi:MAG: DUF4286 family protein [Bacteroidota bacterium]
MILYNVTTKINRDRANDWLDWLSKIHIPKLFQTGLFLEYKICHLLGMNDPDDETFAVQYFFESIDTFNQYQQQHAKAMQQDAIRRFGDCAASFRTVMEVLDAS